MAGKPAVDVQDRPVAAVLSAGLTSAEARRRLAEFGPNSVTRKDAAALAQVRREILVAGALDA